MQRHSTSYPQALIFLDIQTQGCLSFEQFGYRLKVRWIISAAKLSLAIITGTPHRKWQARSQNVLRRNHGTDQLLDLRTICATQTPSLARHKGLLKQTNKTRTRWLCRLYQLLFHQHSWDLSREQPVRAAQRCTAALTSTAQGLCGFQTGDPGWNKSCVLLWWNVKF